MLHNILTPSVTTFSYSHSPESTPYFSVPFWEEIGWRQSEKVGTELSKKSLYRNGMWSVILIAIIIMIAVTVARSAILKTGAISKKKMFTFWVAEGK